MTVGPRWMFCHDQNVTGKMPINSNGYVIHLMPNHPHADPNGYVFEHRIIVERAMGKVLRRSASVHHVDERRSNNAPTNLVACDSEGYHSHLHKRLRAFRACGDASAVRCGLCHGYDLQEDIRRVAGGYGRHRSCEAAYKRSRTLV